jgi:hypothetical protein
MRWSKGVIVGAGGEFHFDDVPAGEYECVAGKPGFHPQSGPPQQLKIPRSPAGPVQLDLTPYGAIGGTVVNQFGEPMEWVRVVVSSVHTWNGEQAIRQIGNLRTDQHGRFLLTRLAPGPYYVKAIGRDGGTETRIGLEKGDYTAWESFPPVYFGGARDRGSATSIQVAAGAVAQADFRLELQRAFKIRGRVIGYRGPDSVRFELLQGDDPSAEQRAVLNGETGLFEIQDVLPGQYTLRAVQSDMAGEAAVVVKASDLDEISISLKPRITIHVLMRSAASPAAPLPAPTCLVFLSEHRRHEADLMVDGEMLIRAVLPGEYRVRVGCSGGYPAAASFGGADLLSNPVISITSSAAPPIEIALQPGGGTLKARFDGEAGPTRAVLVVPSFPTFAGPDLCLPAFLRPFPGGSEAIFNNLAPGEYSVYGLSELRDVEYHNPAFLQSLTGGVTVHIEDGKTVEVTLPRISK